MFELIAFAALTLTTATTPDLTLPPEGLADESGVAIGEVLPLAHDASVQVIQIIEDSRCPIDVQCVQAGRLVVRVLAKRGNQSQELVMEPWASAKFAEGTLTFSSAPQRSKAGNRKTAKTRAKFDFSYVLDQKIEKPQPETDAS